MQIIDKLRLLGGILMGLMLVYFLVGLLPDMQRLQQTRERRLESGGGALVPISGLRRAAGLLMSGMLAGQLIAGAFHCDLGKMTGISLTTLCCITFLLLPSMVVLSGIQD
jgi:hypothetical protein